MTTPSASDVDQLLHHLLSTIDATEAAIATPSHLDPFTEIAHAIHTAWPHGRPPTVDELGVPHDTIGASVGDSVIDQEIHHYPWQHDDHAIDAPVHHEGVSHLTDFDGHDHHLGQDHPWI